MAWLNQNMLNKGSVYIVGIGGTFMAGVATIAKQLGYEVSGCDYQIYPPMSDVLKSQGIKVTEGYDHVIEEISPDLYIIGNAAKRGMPIVECILDNRCKFQSGPQWLFENALINKRVVAVAGTHGKTTTSSMISWVLEQADLNPGFLIGGAPKNFNCSAKVTNSPFFVIEADEYNTAFFDKRSKLVHYQPEVALINNLEFDHADIFDSIEDIQKQLHGMIRTMPSKGLVIYPDEQQNISTMIDKGCWTPCEIIDREKGLHAKLKTASGASFEIWFAQTQLASIQWGLLGEHNIQNAVATWAVCQHFGLTSEQIVSGLETFKSVSRRMELKYERDGYKLYDDFAHHPTAIKSTLEGFKNYINHQASLVILEFGSFTMRQGVMFEQVIAALSGDDPVILLNTPINYIDQALPKNISKCQSINHLPEIIKPILSDAKYLLVMSNKGNKLLHQVLQNTIDDLYL